MINRSRSPFMSRVVGPYRTPRCGVLLVILVVLISDIRNDSAPAGDDGFRNEWTRYNPGTGPNLFLIDGIRATCFICADGGHIVKFVSGSSPGTVDHGTGERQDVSPPIYAWQIQRGVMHEISAKPRVNCIRVYSRDSPAVLPLAATYLPANLANTRECCEVRLHAYLRELCVLRGEICDLFFSRSTWRAQSTHGKSAITSPRHRRAAGRQSSDLRMADSSRRGAWDRATDVAPLAGDLVHCGPRT